MHARRHLSLLALQAAILAVTTPALAEPVLVEFTAFDGSSLSPGGDDPGGASTFAEGDVRKRVEEREADIAEARLLLLATLAPDLAAAVTGDYRHFPLLRADVDPAQRRALLAHPQVAAVHDDRQRSLLTDSSLPFMNAGDWHGEGFDGADTAVAVLDTGIRYWNGFFGDCPEPGAESCRVLVFEGFATLAWGTGSTDPVEVANASDHGTNVGGIVGAVAPATGLLSLGVFARYDPDEATGFRGDVLANDGDVAEALDWVIEHRDEYNIVAANMSLGSEVDQSVTGHCSGMLAGAYESVFAACREAGVLPVVATGNDYVKTAIAPPSCVAAAVAVGAGYDDPAFGYECGTGPVEPGAVTCFSDSNAFVDLVAPGNDIDAGGIYGMSGTSMAAPHVAGLVALYQARYGTTPVWTLERMRADAVPIAEIGPRQTFIHRSARVGDAEAVMTFDTGAVLASDFQGLSIPDGSEIPLQLSEDVACDGPLCASGVAGHVYLDLNLEHRGTGDLVIELEAPDGTVARREVAGDDELGVEHVNSIIGSQHLPDAFEALAGTATEGPWVLRLFDDTLGREGSLYRAVLLIDSARVELRGELAGPEEPPRPDEPFEVVVDLANRGNLAIDGADLTLELVSAATGEVAASAPIDLEVPMAPGQTAQARPTLQGPQGAYEVRLAGALDPDLAPGLVADPLPVDITYRTFASFSVDPEAPAAGEPVQLRIISRGMVEGQSWAFGDGAGSEEAAPVHAWAQAGTYEVSLTVTGPDGASTTARSVTVVGGAPADADLAAFDAGGGGCDCGAAGSVGEARGGLGLFALALLGLLALRRRAGRSRLALALALAAAGCWDDTPAGDGGADADADADVDAPPPGPWVSLLTPPDPTIGDVTIYAMLSSEGGEPCDLTIEQGLGPLDGVEWRPATVEGALADLASGPEGVEHELAWRSTIDVPGDAAEVRLRARATCGGLESPAVASEPFEVLNFFVNNPHAVLIAEISAADDNVPAPVNADYVELVNTTDETIPLQGWRLEASGAGGGGLTVHDLSGAVLEPGGRLVVSELGAAMAGAFELAADLPWTVDAGGSVAVLATSDRGVDFARWGGAAVTPPGGLGWVDDPPLPVPQTLTVLARADEAADGDRASDFCVAGPTPGAAGEGCTPDAEPSDLLITEIASQGTDDQVEVLNTTDDAVNLGGWVLLWDGADLGEGRVPLAGVDVGPGERIVLIDNGLAGDFRNGVLHLGANLNIDGLIPMALALQDPQGTIVDFVAGGGSLVRWVEWDEDAPTPMPGPSTRLSRRTGDPDTDSADDFCLAQPSLLETAGPCLEPIGSTLRISEVCTGRPDWIEIYNPGPDPVDLDDFMVSYTSPYYGGSVGDFELWGSLEPGAVVVATERDLEGLPDDLVLEGARIQLAPEGAGSVAIRDVHGFGVDVVLWGEPPGLAPWPAVWTGVGQEVHDAVDNISIERFPTEAPDTNTRDDWCWAYPSPGNPNASCEPEGK